ncbi:hypothetical protein SAMN02745866_03179 [Alteromonadaceae bacterium Bs31]|nr:hypothetical protein SAMN02745866_03179 [Alteromonadaceae bacterium Bs31]
MAYGHLGPKPALLWPQVIATLAAKEAMRNTLGIILILFSITVHPENVGWRNTD